YRTGVDWMTTVKLAPRRTEAEPVRGHRAVLVDFNKEPGAPTQYQLAWEYRDDAWAVVSSSEGQMNPAELRQVAEAFTPAATPHAVKIAFRLTTPPPGYKVVSIGSALASGQRSAIVLVPDAIAEARLAQPDRLHAPDERNTPLKTISVLISTGPRGIL